MYPIPFFYTTFFFLFRFSFIRLSFFLYYYHYCYEIHLATLPFTILSFFLSIFYKTLNVCVWQPRIIWRIFFFFIWFWKLKKFSIKVTTTTHKINFSSTLYIAIVKIFLLNVHIFIYILHEMFWHIFFENAKYYCR